MKKLLLFLLLATLAPAQTTPTLGLQLPATGSLNWDIPLRANFSSLDATYLGTSCGDSSHAVAWNGITKKFTCQAIATSVLVGSVVTSNGLLCDGTTNDTAAMTTLLATISTTPTRMIFPVGQCLLNTTTFPANVIMDFSGGGALKPATGQTLTILSNILTQAGQKIFFNATAGQGTIDLTGAAVISNVYPEWWGASPSASASVNTPAIQAAINGAYGCGPVACRTNPSGLSQYNRVLLLTGMYNINDELKLYHVTSFHWIGQNKLKSGLVQTAVNKRIIDGQSVSYGTFDNMLWDSTAAQDLTHPLIDIDYDGSQGADLKPQFLTFNDNVFIGRGIVSIGLLIAKTGSSAQGSNIVCYNCAAQNFTQAAAQLGLPGAYAQNALTDMWFGGDIQGSPQYGLAAYGGQWIVQNASFENGPPGTQVGFDVYCQAPQEICDVEHVRSEGAKMIAGDRIRVVDSRTLFRATQWPDGTGLPGSVGTVGQVISGSSIAGDGAYYKVTVGGTFGGIWSQALTGGSATTAVCGGCAWTVNAYVGQLVFIGSGSGTGRYGVITGNTATTITVAAGWTTKFSNNTVGIQYATNPDATSVIEVEPNWGTQTTSGTVTFAPLACNGISGNSDTTASNATLQNVIIAGCKINAVGNFKDVGVTRTDWNAATNPLENSINLYSYENVVARLPGGVGTLWRDGLPMNWAFTRNAVTGYTAPSQKNVGTVPFVWSCSVAAGGQGCFDVSIGGRAKPAISANQAVLEYTGLLGAPTGNGTDVAGVPSKIVGGLPTGAGTPGAIEFWLGSAGAAGVTVTDPTKASFIDTAGFHPNQLTFATLGTPANGTVVFCTDCNATCTAGAGTGRTCFRENSLWTH